MCLIVHSLTQAETLVWSLNCHPPFSLIARVKGLGTEAFPSIQFPGPQHVHIFSLMGNLGCLWRKQTTIIT